jgi:hypothetical protein
MNMDTLMAMARGEASRGEPLKVFDWDKAARLIKERQPEVAGAGLQSDWEWTGGIIYNAGEINTEDYTYLASTWATPELSLDGEIVPCWKTQSDTPNWGSSTKWPPSAVEILNGVD